MTSDTVSAAAAVPTPLDVVNENSRQNPKTARQSKEGDRRRRRRQLKKNNKLAAYSSEADAAAAWAGTDPEGGGETNDEIKENNGATSQVMAKLEVEYVPEKAILDDILREEFVKVLNKFTFNEPSDPLDKDEDKKDRPADNATNKKADSDSDDDEEDNELKESGLSNKKKKLQRRMNIAELKQICPKPDVVEIWDATSLDPKLLVYLKSYRNTVPVPRHWCQKRKYLQGAQL